MSVTFKLKTFLFYSITTLIAVIALTLLIAQYFLNKKAETAPANASYCNYDIKRLQGLSYIKPLMFVDEECPTEDLAPLQLTLSKIIDKYKQNDNLTTASVYLKDFSTNKWTAVNETEKFEPGSLFKVPILIACLKMEEKTPGFLNKEILYDKTFNLGKVVAYENKSIKFGLKYTIKELLKYMISYSDNYATALIETVINGPIVIKMFTDFGLDAPNFAAPQYFFTSVGYSYFMRSIYNASYLTISNSEYAAEVLSTCEFKEGIVKGLPANVKIIHKFGESGNQTEKQLHESAVIYLKNKPYLLTIMTKGRDPEQLPKLIQEISQTVYQAMLSN